MFFWGGTSIACSPDFWAVKSHTVLPTNRHRSDISLLETLHELPRGQAQRSSMNKNRLKSYEKIIVKVILSETAKL